MRRLEIPVLICFALFLSSGFFSSGDVFGQMSQTLEPVANATEFARQISAVDWLGPMSAIALSPFFGLACLSGIANFGPEWATQNSPLLGNLGPMKSPLLFWVMLVLTIITSAPRFTKLSKPIALVAETLESYSAIIILAVMKFSTLFSGQSETHISDALIHPVVMQAGIGEFSTDLVFTLAAATNIIVINTIKLACEFFVWLIPIPFVDSIFEATNKIACGCLALLYAYSPTASAVLNLVLFVACALIFIQVTRYLRYFKYLFIFPVFRASLGYSESQEKTFSGFLARSWKKLPSKTELRMTRLSGDRVEVVYPTWLSAYPKGIAAIKNVEPGLLSDKLTVLLEGESLSLDIRKGVFSVNSSPENSVVPITT
jgi:hypothetical protein